MSVTLFRTAGPSAQDSARRPASDTQDLELTTDYYEERTTDLGSPGVEERSTVDLPAPTIVDAAPAQHEIATAQALARAEFPPAAPADECAPVESPAEAVTAQPDVGGDATEHAVEAPTEAPGVGARLHDRYLIEEVIGAGGVSIVYRARDLRAGPDTTATLVALKTPKPELHDYARARARLAHEHQHTTALSHPNIVRVFELCTDSDPCFMTMELLQGRPLSQMMKDAKGIPAPFAHRILQGCARALAHAHAHDIVHGDFKPGNVFVTRDDVVKVIDFGAAATPQTVQSRIAAGTPAYASPQVLSGATPEVRDDVFSFACVAYELLTGQHPFDRRSSLQAQEENLVAPRAWNLSGSQWFALLAALAWRREQRPDSVDALMTALFSDPPQQADQTPRNDRRDRLDDAPPRRRSWGFFLFIACAIAITWLADRRSNESAQPAPAIKDPPAESAAPPPGDEPAVPLTRAPLGRVSSFTPSAPSDPAPPNSVEPDFVTAEPAAQSDPPQIRSAPIAPQPAKTARRTAAVSELAFETTQVVTSESSVAAVFIVRRSPPLTGRVGARWRTIAGTAQPGEDYAADASGSIEFADGQAQRAIYVPLRNDLKREGPETFSVELHSPRNARLGAHASAQATILDDD